MKTSGMAKHRLDPDHPQTITPKTQLHQEGQENRKESRRPLQDGAGLLGWVLAVCNLLVSVLAHRKDGPMKLQRATKSLEVDPY